MHDDGDCNVEHFVALCPCVDVCGHLGMRKGPLAVRAVSPRRRSRREQPNSSKPFHIKQLVDCRTMLSVVLLGAILLLREGN